jgi:pimeloyl-ACP methyl ester carboxylesterase
MISPRHPYRRRAQRLATSATTCNDFEWHEGAFRTMRILESRAIAGCLASIVLLSAGLDLAWSGEPLPKDSAAQQAGLKKPWFDSDGVPIHYLVTGREDGEPVVLLHGFASSSEAQWSPVIAALQKDYKVIAMDLRGCGGSGKPHDPKKYGIEMMKDVIRLLDHLKIDKAHIVGYSVSAGTGLLLAVHQGQRIRTLSCCGAGTISFGSNTPPAGNPNPDLIPRNALLDALAAALDKRSIAPLTLRLTPKGQPQPTPEAIKAHDAALLSVNDARALAAMIRGAGRKDTRITERQIQDIRVPTLAIVGADDPLKFGVDNLKRLLPGTRVVVIGRAHHLDVYRRPEFVSALKQFLDDHRLPK